jgi:hypothetical protein
MGPNGQHATLPAALRRRAREGRYGEAVGRRTRNRPDLALPEGLVALAEREGVPFERRRIEKQLRAAGVTEVAAMGDAIRPSGIAYKTPINGGWVDVLYDEWESPIVTAFEELTRAVTDFDLLSRLHAAMIDMDLIAEAARALADHREGDVTDAPLVRVAPVVEAGIVTMYARSFTGEAKLGDRWRPVDEADRELHEWLMAARHGVHAHADRTEDRMLVDTNALAGVEGPPIYAERRKTIAPEKLRAIAEMCQRQHARFWIETGQLKLSLGSPATF